MTNNLYEAHYKNDKKHFSFGRNWQSFLKSLNKKKIKEAEKSLQGFLRVENLENKTFVDIGCGSGLFSLAAYNLGAKVVSVDIDDFSIKCVSYLREKYVRKKDLSSWSIEKGSVLDKDFLKSLGKFDIIYSWGVLHHTGNIWEALENILTLCKDFNSLIYLAIYNKYLTRFRGGTSKTWLKIKRMYNNSGNLIKKIILYCYYIYFFIALIGTGRNPYNYIKNYKSNRGMNWYHDVIDWLGGYPYEFASPDEIIKFYGKKNWGCINLTSRDGIGCNEFLLIKI